jgi:DNA-directed RNA polymerase specialized sigma24 family protein
MNDPPDPEREGTPELSTDEQLAILADPAIRSFLMRYLRAAHPGVSDPDREDIASGVLTKLIDRVRRGVWAPEPDRARLESFLRTAARWAVVDHYRSARLGHEQLSPNELMEDLALSDDEAAAALDRSATVGAVKTALTEIQRSDDTTVFMIVTYILDELQRTGIRPSNRQVARDCDISHTAVANAVLRMRPYFAEAWRTAGADHEG